MAPKLKPSRAKYRSTSPITATYSYDNPAPTAAIAPQTFSSNPKTGHAKRRFTSNIAATYSYDDPATPLLQPPRHKLSHSTLPRVPPSLAQRRWQTRQQPHLW